MNEEYLPDGHLQDCASVLSVVVAQQSHVREEQLLHLDDADDQDDGDVDVVVDDADDQDNDGDDDAVVDDVTHQGYVKEEQLFHLV